jgi:mannose-6-phosphate isomerase-like protein (cupin superfamily)
MARFGEMTVEPDGKSSLVTYPTEEQIYVVLEGGGILYYNDQEHPFRTHDFLYLPPGVKHGVSNPAASPCRLIVMGFRLPNDFTVSQPAGLLKANIEDVKKQVIANHPPSTRYQLLLGSRSSTRDNIAAGHIVTSLFVIEFSPGGTNLPHHHEQEEEIYLLLEGEGEMVAGGGTTGIEGRHPARAGDAYFFRLNCTVGFYNGPQSGKARILAVRSLFPVRR